MKSTVFGFDTFWVTSVENYKSDGVVFKGNVRAKDMDVMYKKMTDRMKVRCMPDACMHACMQSSKHPVWSKSKSCMTVHMVT